MVASVVEDNTTARISYIETKLVIPGADAVLLGTGEKIQELQASLACTLRIPLEKIRIQSFIKIFANGVREELSVNPADFYIIGDGTVECYTTGPVGSGRRIQSVGGQETVEVKYVIVEPPRAITDLSLTQLTTVLASSSVLVNTVQSIGGTSIEAVAATPTIAAPTESNGVIEMMKQIVGPSIGGIGGGILIIAGVIVGVKMYKKHKQRLPITQTKKDAEGRILHKNPLVAYDSSRVLPGTNYPGRAPMHRMSQDMTRVAMEPQHVGHGV
jgi:hypothetical protein